MGFFREFLWNLINEVNRATLITYLILKVFHRIESLKINHLYCKKPAQANLIFVMLLFRKISWYQFSEKFTEENRRWWTLIVITVKISESSTVIVTIITTDSYPICKIYKPIISWRTPQFIVSTEVLNPFFHSFNIQQGDNLQQRVITTYQLAFLRK